MLITTGDKGHPEIYELQRILKFLDLYPFAIDGIYGYGCVKAVMLFQHKNNLKVDGIVGPATMAELRKAEKELKLTPPMKLFKIESILKQYQEKAYQLNEEQYKINLLGIRKDDIFDNTFSDRLVIFWKNESLEWEKREFEWTTMPGTYGQGVFNPITTLGLTGTAVLAEGQYLDTWRFYDTYKGWLNYPFFYQEKPVTIYRDGNKDELFDKFMPEQVGLFGINLHRMSGNGVYQKYVNNTHITWSMGCQGAPEPIFRQIVALARISSKFHGNVFTYTLMHRSDFISSRGISQESPDYYTAFHQKPIES